MSIISTSGHKFPLAVVAGKPLPSVMSHVILKVAPHRESLPTFCTSVLVDAHMKSHMLLVTSACLQTSSTDFTDDVFTNVPLNTKRHSYSDIGTLEKKKKIKRCNFVKTHITGMSEHTRFT